MNPGWNFVDGGRTRSAITAKHQMFAEMCGPNMAFDAKDAFSAIPAPTQPEPDTTEKGKRQ